MMDSPFLRSVSK